MMATERFVPAAMSPGSGLLASSMPSNGWHDMGDRSQPVAGRAGCLKVRDASARSQTPESAAAKKSVTFPLDTIFRTAVKDHRVQEVVAILTLLVPETLTSQTLRQHSATASTDIRNRVKVLLDPININQVSARGFSALMLCAGRGQFEAVRLLVVAGVDVQKQASGGWTVFHSAAASGRDDMMRWLLANCNMSYKEIFLALSTVQQELFYALGQEKMAKMKSLLESSTKYLSQQLDLQPVRILAV